jgi:hypothetical protein
VAIENQYDSVGRATLRGLGLGPTEIARVSGLSKQCVYNYLTGRAQPDEKNSGVLEVTLGISAASWRAHRPIGVVAAPKKALTPTKKPAKNPAPSENVSAELQQVETPALPPSNAGAETGVSLIRSADPHEARRDVLVEVRDMIRVLRQQINADPAASQVASLANSLRQYHRVEADILKQLAEAESNFARSAEFRSFVTSLYRGLESVPGGLEALRAALEGVVDDDTPAS